MRSENISLVTINCYNICSRYTVWNAMRDVNDHQTFIFRYRHCVDKLGPHKTSAICIGK